MIIVETVGTAACKVMQESSSLGESRWSIHVALCTVHICWHTSLLYGAM